MFLGVLFALTALPPVAAAVGELSVYSGISERHHSRHDTYAIPASMTGLLVMVMITMGIFGLVMGWLSGIGLFTVDNVTLMGFFASFEVAMLVMWAAMRHYQVGAYDDHLELTPFLGRRRIIRYADIERMQWASNWLPMRRRGLLLIVGGRPAGFLAGTFDLEQLLERIDRNDVLET